MGGGCNKVLRTLGGKPVLVHSLLALARARIVDDLVVVAASGEEEIVQDLLRQFADGAWQLQPSWTSDCVVTGGEERQYSVYNGLQALPGDCRWVIVHDGARPWADEALFRQILETARQKGNAVVAVPVTDTVKHVAEDGRILSTPDRNTLWSAQTPQAFRYEDLMRAHQEALRDGFRATDDAQLLERLGIPVYTVKGDPGNRKLTYPEDLPALDAGDAGQHSLAGMVRVGFGYDIHRLETGRPCILCGVEIPFSMGPAGHSDGDVPVHALMDAMLGAAGMRDIGHLFPNDDPAYKGADSLELLRQVRRKLNGQGWSLINADLTLVAEQPKIQPYVEQMTDQLAETLEVPRDRLAIKATTNERVGELGRGRAIAAYAVVQIQHRSP